MPEKPRIYLIAVPISEEELFPTVTEGVWQSVKDLRRFVVEDEKTARRILKKHIPGFPLSGAQFFLCNEHSSAQSIQEILNQLKGKDFAVLSEAGCPCVADPGSEIVRWAHQESYQIIPLVGPSSIVLALMASGLPGQSFAFHGYLPKDKQERFKKMKELERRSEKEQQTQIFMETPYRNQQLFGDFLEGCSSSTLLSVAIDLTSKNEWIKTATVAEWKKQNNILPKSPGLFLIYKP
jgi:16S rRNA (cytidine1402-2'-O)-methyltransferase